jgi:hypothetical protein
MYSRKRLNVVNNDDDGVEDEVKSCTSQYRTGIFKTVLERERL